MADFKIARIRYTWKGAWVGTTSYVKDDVANYGGKTYVCMVTHTSSSTFLPDLTATTPNWRLMFDGYTWRSTWAISTLYNPGDMVRYNGIVYRCLTSHTSNALIQNQISTVPVVGLDNVTGLEADQAKWEIVAKTHAWQNTWSINTRYKVGDIVKYGAIVYKCNTAHNSAASTSSGLEAHSSYWDVVLQQSEYKTDWTASYRYKVGDIVKWGGTLWKCNTQHTSNTFAIDLGNWAVYLDGLQYESNTWVNSTIYQEGDVVGYGGYKYRAIQNNVGQNPVIATAYWSTVTQNYNFRGDWAATYLLQPVNYLVGDVIRFNGYLYTAILDNTNVKPPNGTYWQQLNLGHAWRGVWQQDTFLAPVEYRLGDLVTFGSHTYNCILTHVADSTLKRPNQGSGAVFTVVKDGTTAYASVTVTTAGTGYYVGQQIVILGSSLGGATPTNDITLTVYTINVSKGITAVTFSGTATGGAGSTTGLTDPLIAQNYWENYVLGNPNNVMTTPGDTVWYNNSATARLPAGTDGQVLRVSGTNIQWTTFGAIFPKVYYVATYGTDLAGYGLTLDKPYRTVKYACDNVPSNSTIFIKTGIYSEQLPITIPADVALVGDELRGTVIQPASGYTGSNMFYVRNGTGIRNMTLQGLTGTLGPFNSYLTKRPSGGAYVSLDPLGATNPAAQITSKSPYVQNVTALGTGCVGLKIDGDLHGGGNKSIVANDFTMVISDGIGAWVTNKARSELVSVFTYYNHIGYLCENGGKIRATDGNNSYGDYGSVSEGTAADEIPITGTVNNIATPATIGFVFCDGQNVLGFEYDNAGKNYNSSTTFSITGTGLGATVSSAVVRNGGVMEIRLVDPGTGNSAGGSGYLNVVNNAQVGYASNGTIYLAQSDSNASVNYVGLRIVIIAGKGAGQYGYIQAYNATTKMATIYTESTQVSGWDHVVTGTAAVDLDTTTQYSIEPRVTFSTPTSGTLARARAVVVSGRISKFRIMDPGSGYASAPTIVITDPNRGDPVSYVVRIGNGVLSTPNFSSRGTNYLTASATILTGTGYADAYQYGSYLYVNNLTNIPGPGANITISGNPTNATNYRLVSIDNISGAGPYAARIQLNPTLDLAYAPDQGNGLVFRVNYSQVRLTGHDFLEIGTGNFATTNYPNQDITTIKSGHLAAEFGGGRVFYTATDQDGNFRVGTLFKVEQSTGIATLNASFFNLSGLTQISLGAIVLGGTSATITEISTDATLPANSDGVIVTQRAIKSYIASRIGGGGANLSVNAITAGFISISNSTTGGVVNQNIQNTQGFDPVTGAAYAIGFKSKVLFTGGVDGHMLASSYFIASMR